MNEVLKNKKQNLYFILCGIFITNAVVAEIIGAKIFSVSATIGLAGHASPLINNMNMSAGVLNWPIVFIVSDIINEYFGRRGVRKISYLTAGLIAYCFVVIYGATSLSPAAFWVDMNKGNDNLNIDSAFKLIFRQGMGIILGSIVAFLLGQILDALVFHRLRTMANNKFLWLRATGSTLVSQLIDSLVVIFIAFYVFGNWSFDQTLTVGLTNYVYKVIIAVCLTPVIYLVHRWIDSYLGKENIAIVAEEAMKG